MHLSETKPRGKKRREGKPPKVNKKRSVNRKTKTQRMKARAKGEKKVWLCFPDKVNNLGTCLHAAQRGSLHQQLKTKAIWRPGEQKGLPRQPLRDM